jgi:hypothetical protein
MLRLRLSSVNPCKSASKKGGRKGFRLAVNLATQIDTIKKRDYPDLGKLAFFGYFSETIANIRSTTRFTSHIVGIR